MDMYFLISYAALYIRKTLGLKQVADHMLELFFFYFVVVPIGTDLFAWIKNYLLAGIKKYLPAWIKDYLLSPMWLRLGFLLYYNRNINNLRIQLENLRITRNEVQGLVDAAERNGEVILPRVKRWQDRAIDITEDSVNLLDYKRPLNPVLRCQRSKSAKEKTAEVDKLIQKGSSFDRVSTLLSRILIYERIIRAIKDSETNRIGLLGVGGVGKTTLVKEIYKEAKDGDLLEEDGNPFEQVVIATVSSRPDLERIQYEIADMLGLQFDKLSSAGRARRLLEIFDRRMRSLIILDDIHGIVELEDIGIPFKERFKGCKIVLVSRSQDVCDDLGTERDFLIEALSEDEGLILFRRMAGVPVYHQDPLADEVARNCAGLPRNIQRAANAWRRQLFPQIYGHEGELD